jgi:hypothetical protein
LRKRRKNRWSFAGKKLGKTASDQLKRNIELLIAGLQLSNCALNSR